MEYVKLTITPIIPFLFLECSFFFLLLFFFENEDLL